MTAFRAHTKQFLLGPKPARIWPDWTIIEMADGLFLSACPRLRATRLHTREGIAYWLLGLAILADDPGRTIAELFPSKHASEIEEWTGFWAGRWALVSADGVWPDASGCLGIHHRIVGGEVWISSSPALLGDHVPGAPSEPYIAWHVLHRTGIDWIPVPLTTRENVYKLMALRTIHPVTGDIRPVRFRAAERDEGANGHALATALKTIMTNWGRIGYRQRYLGLTAGVDTRTVLAAASAAGVVAEACTIAYPEASRADLVLPPKLAAMAGIPHKLVRKPTPPLPLPEILARADAIAEHIDGATYHPVSSYFANGLDDFMHDAGCTMATGHILDLGRCFYWRRFANAGLGEALPTADQVLDAFFTRPTAPLPFWSRHPRARWREAVQIWLDSLATPRALKLDWRDAFHLDQGSGGWESTVLRAMDVVDGTYFPAGNCIWVLHLLTRYPVEQRMASFAYTETVRELFPALAKVPINPPGRIARVKRRARRLLGERATNVLKSYLRKLKLR